MNRAILSGKAFTTAGSSFPAELLTNLLAWYKLDETSGTRVNAVSGSFNLSVTGTVNNTTGKIGNAAVFPAGTITNYLSGSTSASFGINQDFSVFGWVYCETGISTYPFGKFTAGNYDWVLGLINSTSVQVAINNASINQTFSGSAISVNAWNLVGFTHSVSAKRIRVYVNGSLYGSEHIYAPTVSDAGNQFYIGGGYLNDWQIRVDEVGVWQREITASNVTTLYNAGNGITY